jgi:hypothetical protein
MAASVLMFMASSSVMADSEAAFVRQIEGAQRAPVPESSPVAAFSSPGHGTINSIDVNYLDELALPGQGRQISTIIQRGDRNRAKVSVQGGNNATLQRQTGVDLTSSILVSGGRNAIAVDQRGVGLTSDIDVLGANKKILHLQRGRGTNNASVPLLYTGAEPETVLVLDTPKGRLIKPLNSKPLDR